MSTRSIAIAVCGFVAIAVTACSSGGGGQQADLGATPSTATTAPTASSPEDRFGAVTEPEAPLGNPAPTPQEAVIGFVSAEQAGDYRAAFSLLAAPDRAEARSAAGWRSEHKRIPALISATVTETVHVAPDRAEVRGPVSLQPRLDPIAGLVPASADATWVVLAEDGGWRVNYAEAAFKGHYLDDDAAATSAVSRWASSRQQCGRVDAEYPGGLAGAAGLANRLCKAPGAVAVGQPGPLKGPETAPVVAAFGPEAELWAKVVPVTDPVPMRAVVAPIGDRWTVIGLLSPPAGQK
jgi:hypothetical protein